jgi:hypothetical protein
MAGKGKGGFGKSHVGKTGGLFGSTKSPKKTGLILGPAKSAKSR